VKAKGYITNTLVLLAAFFSIMIIATTCGPERKNTRTPHDSTFDNLRARIIKLEGTIAQIDNFVASDFANCSTGLPAFETKICEIAQTATAEQAIKFTSQLQIMTKNFQERLYGEDCTNTTDAGCPVAGSITAKVAANEVDIATLQSDVTTLQTDVNTLEGRLDNFDGTGNSIETVITNIKSDIAGLETRIENIEDTLASGDVYKTAFICGDIVESGPVYEAVLITGDDMKMVAYVSNGGTSGLGVFAEAGVTGDYYGETDLNTKSCTFKVYDNVSSIKLCWDNSDRKATEIEIDAACDVTPQTADCTCAN